MSFSPRRRVAVLALGVVVGLSGLGPMAFAQRNGDDDGEAPAPTEQDFEFDFDFDFDAINVGLGDITVTDVFDAITLNALTGDVNVLNQSPILNGSLNNLLAGGLINGDVLSPGGDVLSNLLNCDIQGGGDSDCGLLNLLSGRDSSIGAVLGGGLLGPVIGGDVIGGDVLSGNVLAICSSLLNDNSGGGGPGDRFFAECELLSDLVEGGVLNNNNVVAVLAALVDGGVLNDTDVVAVLLNGVANGVLNDNNVVVIIAALIEGGVLSCEIQGGGDSDCGLLNVLNENDLSHLHLNNLVHNVTGPIHLNNLIHNVTGPIHIHDVVDAVLAGLVF